MAGYHTFYRVKLDKETEKRGAARNLLICFSNSIIKEIMAVTVFGYLILISIDCHNVISPFSP